MYAFVRPQMKGLIFLRSPPTSEGLIFLIRLERGRSNWRRNLGLYM